MSIISRFFGRKEPAAGQPNAEPAALVSNPDQKDGMSLQVAFAGPLPNQADALTRALQAYHPSMADARAELDTGGDHWLGLAGWGEHVVRLVGFNAPLPEATVEVCVAPAHYPAEVKAEVRAHASHVLLYYTGHDADPLEQYVAVAAVAGALAEAGGVAVMNEHATRRCRPACSRAPRSATSLELLRSLPLTMLYCGFVKYEVEGTEGVWMRTYGADRFGLPDFAALAEGITRASSTRTSSTTSWPICSRAAPRWTPATPCRSARTPT